MFPFKYKDGTEPKVYDIVNFNVYDYDDFVNLKFICILTPHDFIYISGGMDCGLGAGKRISFKEAMSDAENNDEDFRGFTKLGTHYQLPSVIARGFGI